MVFFSVILFCRFAIIYYLWKTNLFLYIRDCDAGGMQKNSLPHALFTAWGGCRLLLSDKSISLAVFAFVGIFEDAQV